MRLIDADSLKDYIDCGHLRPPTELCFSELDVCNMIDKRPTIDAVEVVRCKDCKWWGGNKNTEHNNHICNRALIQEVDYWTRADDYCSHGKRKGGDEA